MDNRNLKDRHIRINAVSPGSIDTPGLSDLLASSKNGSAALMTCEPTPRSVSVTSSGSAARPLPLTKRLRATRHQTSASPRPWLYFPFSGWKNSFFGDLHGQGRDAIEFYTDKKVVSNAGPKSTAASSEPRFTRIGTDV